jgi:signal transduction histidine kinase
MALKSDRLGADSAARESKKRAFSLRPGLAKRRQLEEDLSHVNQEIYRRNLELDQNNKMLALLEAVDKLVLESESSLHPLCTQLAKKVVEEADYPFVGILAYEGQQRDKATMFGWATNNLIGSVDPKLIDGLTLKTSSAWFKNDEPLKFVNIDLIPDDKMAEFCDRSVQEVKELKSKLKIQQTCCVKLRARQRLVGIMIIGTTNLSLGPEEFTRSLLTRLSEATGIAIDHKMLIEENQKVLEELEDSNSKLRVLDRAKDDFISMASHQLRTPLTSVKGYISMVLDGDAGKVSEPQEKLLAEAFTASQRMVYLIGDFLNVSRLQTGKFVIEPKPTNLSVIISEEISQLQTTAARRKITLAYDPPQNFPSVMLDENKIRQVIMNFIDNAIFYSKQGGKVEVALLLKGDEIRFEVRDHGIGVPEADRHKLFTKFFRAENARQARPDGTGIGLFMARKVIIAHGGSIIFETEENVGSTFGFSLPLKNNIDNSVNQKANS